MGLDMYLYKRTYVGANWGHRNIVFDFPLQINGEPIPIKKDRVSYIIEEVCYWRKANAIHRWFVENIQEGIDDCREYELSAEDLQDLVNVCKKVKEDLSLGPELLPVQDGFFFGTTKYNNYYEEDLEDTIKNIEEVLSEPDAEDAGYSYRASW